MKIVLVQFIFLWGSLLSSWFSEWHMKLRICCRKAFRALMSLLNRLFGGLLVFSLGEKWARHSYTRCDSFYYVGGAVFFLKRRWGLFQLQDWTQESEKQNISMILFQGSGLPALREIQVWFLYEFFQHSSLSLNWCWWVRWGGSGRNMFRKREIEPASAEGRINSWRYFFLTSSCLEGLFLCLLAWRSSCSLWDWTLTGRKLAACSTTLISSVVFWLFLKKVRARSCLVFHYLTGKTNFSWSWAGKEAWWVVKAGGLFKVCVSNTEEGGGFLFTLFTLAFLALE